MLSNVFISFTALLPAVIAFTIDTPTNWKGNQTNTVSWTTTSTDPTTFSVELLNTQFHDSFALANDVQGTLGSLAIPLPQIKTPGPGFVIEFIDISNISNVFATSGSFSIQEQDTESTTSGASASGASTAPGSAGGSATTLSATAPAPITTTPGSTSSTVGPITVTSSPGSSSDTGASSAASPTPTGAASPIAVGHQIITAGVVCAAALFGF